MPSPPGRQGEQATCSMFPRGWTANQKVLRQVYLKIHAPTAHGHRNRADVFPIIITLGVIPVQRAQAPRPRVPIIPQLAP